jgi:rhomboid protease GluP
MNLGFSRTPATRTLMIVIAGIFALQVLSGSLRDEQVLIGLGAIIPGIFQSGDYWRLVAAMFLHAGWLHVALNLWALYQLGSLYEAMFGSLRFTFIYFASGLAASIASALHVQGASVGASGAIFGILGAFIFSILRSPQWRHQRWARSLLNQLIFWAVLNLIIGFTVPMIDNYAHIGGLLTGLLLGLIPHRVPPPPPSEAIIDTPAHYGSE